MADPDHRQAVALAGRMVRARAPGDQGRACPGNRRRTQGQQRPANMKPDEAVVYDFVNELSAKHQVSDQTFKRAKELLSEQQVVDLTAVRGNLCNGRDATRDGGRRRAARQGAPVQGRRTVTAAGSLPPTRYREHLLDGRVPMGLSADDEAYGSETQPPHAIRVD